MRRRAAGQSRLARSSPRRLTVLAWSAPGRHRRTPPRSHSHPSGEVDLARRIGPRDRLESRALLRGSLRREIWISSGLRGGASGLRESPGFGRLDLFGIPWIPSEMSLFNGLHATPSPFLIHAALSPQSGAQIPGYPSIRRSTALKPLARRKPLGAPRHGNRHRKGRTSIGSKLTPSSLFGKKLSNSAPLWHRFGPVASWPSGALARRKKKRPV